MAFLPVGAAHAEALAALHRACFCAPEVWPAEAMASLLAQPGVFGFAAEDGLVLARVAADEAEILTLCVAPGARRAGHGRLLLGRAEAEARARGAERMFLEVAADNAAGRALYASAGYAETGRRRGYYPGGGDALVLSRALAGPSVSRPAR